MVEHKVSLKSWNTFGFGIDADLLVKVQSVDELRSLWKSMLIPQSNPLILGGGSNILFTGNYRGLVLKNELTGREIIRKSGTDVWVKFASGENWHQSVLWCVDQGFGGIENLSLIPGTVGAAPIQNIGAYGVELVNVFESLEAFDLQTGEVVTIPASECHFGYRDSIFKHKAKGRYFILSVTLKLNTENHVNISYGDISKTLEERGISNPGIKDVSDAVISIRQSKLPDPAEIGNCGSFFKNPVIPESRFEELKKQFPDIRSFPAAEGMIKIPAAWLIEKGGWKGYRKGDAGVHAKQALVLVNYGTARGSEIRDLAQQIQADIKSRFGVELEMEVNVR